MQAFGVGRIVGFYGAMTVVSVLLMTVGSTPGFGESVHSLVAVDWSRVAAHAAAGMTVGVLLAGASRLCTWAFVWARRLSSEFRSLLGELRAREALVVAMCSGIAEESMFRGVVQPAAGFWVATAIFAVLHVGPTRAYWPWPLMAFVGGLAFAGLYEWSGGLLAPVLAHACVNYLNLRFLGGRPARVELLLGPLGEVP